MSPTPRGGYFLKDGTKVPGTTTILGRWKESGGLMQWSFQQGVKQGQEVASGKRTEPPRLYDEAEKAADIGTCAHGMVEMSIEGITPDLIDDYALHTLPDPDMREKAHSAFDAYLKWADNFKMKVVMHEQQLVSEKYRYGGTPDAVATVGNALALIDFKTSGSVYEDYLYQLAAYGQLWNENHPDNPITGGFHLCRFAKSNGDFGHYYYASLDDELEGFLLMRRLYDISKQTKKRAA